MSDPKSEDVNPPEDQNADEGNRYIRTELGEMNEIESMCPRCQENGMTRLMITKIPHFKEIIVSSFDCSHCGERNNEVTFGGVFGPKKIKYELEVKNRKDMDRQVVKSEFATIQIPELELEIPPESQRGVLNTVEGVLQQTIDGLQFNQPLRKIQEPELYEKIEKYCEKLLTYKTGDIPFTLILEDPAGNSYIEGYYDYYHPTKDQQLTKYEYERTDAERRTLSLAPSYNTERTAGEQNQVDEGQFEDIVLIQTDCPACKKPGDLKTHQCDIPYFKDTVIMSFKCDYCGYRNNKITSGGKVSEKGLRITLTVEKEADLKRDVLKSETATLLIPEVALEVTPGTMGGFFSTVEGAITQVRDTLANLPQAEFSKGDSANENEKSLLQFCAELDELLTLKKTFSFILDDPLANIYIQNPRDHLPPPDNNDPQLAREEYTRTYDQDEELGFHQMQTD